MSFVRPSVRVNRLKKFKTLWEELDEDTKQVISGALYVLYSSPADRPRVVVDTIAGFSDYHLEILHHLTEHTSND